MTAKTAPRVWKRFLRHLERLGTVGAASRVAGMPSDVTVRAKIKSDPEFARQVRSLWKRRNSTAKVYPARYSDDVWQTFVDNLEIHGTINAVTRLAGMPAGATVYYRLGRDPAFAAQVRAVWKPRADARHCTPADWYLFLDKLAILGTPLSVCSLPDMPSYPAYRRKRSLDPLFASRADAVWRRCEISDDAWEKLLSDLTRFGLLEASSQPNAPCAGSVWRRRRIEPAFDARVKAIICDPAYRHLHRLKADDIDWDEFLEIAAEHRSMRAAYAHPGVPQETAVQRRARSDPSFRSALAAIMRRQTEARIVVLANRRMRPRKVKVGKRTAQRAVAETFQVALSRDELYATVAAAVPKSLPPITRDDIICDMMLGVLEGQIDVGRIKANAKDYIRAHWRMFGTLRDKSLDVALFDDGASTLGDRLAGHGADYW